MKQSNGTLHFPTRAVASGEKPRRALAKLPRGQGCLVYKGNGSIYWRVKLPGEAKRRDRPLIPPGEATSTKSAELARAIVDDLIERHFYTPGAHNRNRVSMRDWLRDWESHHRAKAVNDYTAKYTLVRLRRFFRAMSIREIEQITTPLVERYVLLLRKLGYAKNTIRHHFHAISGFCKWAVREHRAGRGGLPISPTSTEAMQAPPARRVPPVDVRDADVRVLLARCRAMDRRSVAQGKLKDPFRAGYYIPMLVASECGLRVSEIGKLEWSDVRYRGQDDQEMYLLVGASFQAKNKQYRAVPVPPRLRRILEVMRERTPLTVKRIFQERARQQWTGAFNKRAAGLPSFGQRKGGAGNAWHALRAFCATRKAMDPATTQWQLMYEMGWSDPKIALHYVNLYRVSERAARTA